MDRVSYCEEDNEWIYTLVISKADDEEEEKITTKRKLKLTRTIRNYHALLSLFNGF